VVSDSIRDFFTASASVGGALIGLLFVAISVGANRFRDEEDGQLHRVRAAAALTAFTNSLSVSLFALIPGEKIGGAAVAVAVVGLTFVLASLLSLIRLRQVRWRNVRDELFLVGLAVTLVYQLILGWQVLAHPDDSGDVETIAILVVTCFLFGISRSWELIGGPTIGIRREVTALVRSHGDDANGREEHPPTREPDPAQPDSDLPTPPTPPAPPPAPGR
jgi:hypothetical protein